MQLKQRLAIILTLMAMFPLLILLLQVLERVEADIEQRISSEIQQTLAKLSQEINTELNNQKSIAFGLAKVPVVREFALLSNRVNAPLYDQKAIQLAAFFLNYQSTVPSIQALRFTDLKGRTLVKVKEGHLVPVMQKRTAGRAVVELIESKPFFKHALKSDQKIIVSDFERGEVIGEVDFCPAMVRYTVPLYDDLDVKLGMLIINMWGRRVDYAVEGALGGTPGNAYIVEINRQNKKRDGIYLYHKQGAKRFANQVGSTFKFSSDIGAEHWQTIQQTKQFGKIAKQGRLFFYHVYTPYKDRNTQWLLVIDIPRDTLFSPTTKIRSSISLLILAVLIVSLLLARWIAAKLAQPIQQMSTLMTRYADGERQLRYEGKRSDEIESVGQAFNYLSNKLEKAELEREQAEAAVRQSERLAAIGQMAAGIGHEINNPLMNIQSLAKLIKQYSSSDDVQLSKDLHTMQAEVKRCAHIVQGILNFAKETDVDNKDFNLISLLSETVALYAHQARQQKVAFEQQGLESFVLYGDRSQLQQVFVNIISNALQASKPGSIIKVLTHAEHEQWVVVEILDEGVGVLPEHLSQLFNPFFSTKPEGQGTGLGLSVSYGIVQNHRGEVIVRNRDPHGVRVIVRLPVDHRELTKYPLADTSTVDGDNSDIT